MNIFLKHKLVAEYSLISIIFLLGLYFRLKGISLNHSFWSDEAYVASLARGMVLGTTRLVDGLNTIPYQRLHLLTIYYSFKIFGLSEWAARLPSVIFGSLGIFAGYLLAKKLSNKWGGYLAAFLIGFSQISLSQSTQAKPYAAILTLILFSHYFLLNLFDVKPAFSKNKFHVLIIIMNSLATLFNYLGVIAWIPYLIYWLVRARHLLKNKTFLFIGIATTLILVFLLRIPYIFFEPLSPKYNWFFYFNELFFRQYLVFTLPAVIGFLGLKNNEYKFSLIIQFGCLFVLWTFFRESHNVRYLYSLFGIIFVLFSVFWASFKDKYPSNNPIVIPLVILVILVSGYKIIRKPAVYYTPNADLFADVQNADYKTFFNEWRAKYPDFEKYPIFAGPFDSLAWYTNRFPTTTFNRFTLTPRWFPQFGFYEYPNLSDFIREQKKYPQGFVMIHDWVSYMSDDIKNYTKQNLRLEIRVDSMSVSPDEKWPLELYSWGFYKK